MAAKEANYPQELKKVKRVFVVGKEDKIILCNFNFFCYPYPRLFVKEIWDPFLRRYTRTPLHREIGGRPPVKKYPIIP